LTYQPVFNQLWVGKLSLELL